MPDSRSVNQMPLTEGQQRIVDELHKCKPMTPDDRSGRLIALRDHLERMRDAWRSKAQAFRQGGMGSLVWKGKAASYEACAADVDYALDELITALLRPPLQENTEEETEDDPRHPASVLRSETEPTR